MTEIKGKYAGEVMRYVDAVIDGRIVAGEDSTGLPAVCEDGRKRRV